MAKNEYEGVCYTSMLDLDGVQYSVTERAESSLDAYENLRATVAVMLEEGCVPFLSYTNKASLPDVLSAPATVSVVDTATGLGGVVTATTPSPQTMADAFPSDAPQAAPIEDGSMYLGIKLKKPKVAECPQGYSYDIIVDAYSADEKEIRFYNDHAEYPACTHNWKSDFGKEKFAEIFPNWTPQRGSKVKLTTPVKLFVKGEGTTSEGNAYQNLKSAEQA